MSNIIVNADISENSSFASNLTKLSKSKTVAPSKISEPNDNNIHHDKSSFISKTTRLSPKAIVLNADMSENSSLVSNLTRLSQLSTKTPAIQSEQETPLSFQRSVVTSVASNASDTKLSIKPILISPNPTISNVHSENSDKQPIHNKPINMPIHNKPINMPIHNKPISMPIHNKQINMPIHNKHINVPIHNKQINMPIHNTPINTPINNKPINNKPINNKPINNKPINNKPINNKPINNKPINNKPNNIPINNTPINTPSIVTNPIIQKLDDITNRVVIDVAVLCQEYTTIDTMCHDNIINLDEILITKEIFQSIFYPYHDNFGLNKDFVNNNINISSHISFIPEFRSVNSKKFYLLEEIVSNIERDLNISRNCFTKESLVELTNEIISIKSLCDINCCSVLASLSWKNILEIIKNYKLINYCQCEKGPESDEKYCHICKTSKSEIIPICVVNIIFKTPTPGVKNTIIRFNYRITNL